MLSRAAIVYVSFASVMVTLAVYLQDANLTLAHALWASLFALPLGFATLRGGLGAERLEYPSASFIVLGMWTIAMSPSFIVDHADAHLIFRYSEQGLLVGRWLFFLWCLVFIAAAGPANRERVRLEPSAIDVIAISVPIMIAVTYQIIAGQFSNYQGVKGLAPSTDGDANSVATAIAGSALLALPSLFLTVMVRGRTPVVRWFASASFAATWLLLFLAGGRSPMGFAAAVCFFAARVLGLRFRLGVSLVVAVALPISFFLIFNYRTALQNSEERVSSVAGFTSVAIDSTQAIVSERATRQDAMLQFSDNARSRLWYGPQYFAVVDEWLDSGAGLHGTFLDGMIRALPSWFFASKNQLADSYAIETHLIRTGRFPDMDLGPTPWMQWLFEFGTVGTLLGAALYGLLVRWIDRRIATTPSVYVSFFWYAVLCVVCAPEHVTDGLFITARNLGTILGIAYLIALALRRLIPQPQEPVTVPARVPARVARAERV